MSVSCEILGIITVHQVKKDDVSMSILLTSKIHHWNENMKFTTQQLRLWMINDKQSVYCFTPCAQSVLLPGQCMTSDVDATAWSVIAQSMILWSNFCHYSTRCQMCLDVIDVTNACLRYTRCSSTLHTAAGVPHTAKNCNKSMAEINTGYQISDGN